MANRFSSPRFLTREQAASELQVCLTTLDKFIKDGTIPSFKIGRSRLIIADELDKYILSQAGISPNESCNG